MFNPLLLLLLAMLISSAVASAAFACNDTTFPVSLDGQECRGLRSTPTGPNGHPISSAGECGSDCCAKPTCSVWNWRALVQPGTKAPGGCWTASGPLSQFKCYASRGWTGRGNRAPAPPPPPPPPCPSPPGTLGLCETPWRDAVPLPFTPPAANTINVVTGETFGADSRSFLLNGSRFYPIGGEVHLARLTESEWEEQLMRMKGGGLNMVSVYVFWIHHEEKRGVFDFTGRRNIRKFVETAKQIGLKVLMRIGPWDHGECRNGGHPDWVLEGTAGQRGRNTKSTTCGTLRSVDPRYLACVEGWYQALAAELKGLYWSDGGPVMISQVDNETPDWKFLLALKALGEKHGIEPVFYSKTGWPAPAPGYPAAYPMLPYFGGYPDIFFTSKMSPQPSSGAYQFGGDSLKHEVPAGYPYLGVEIGGGMAAAYNHRTHMFPEDMPSMHTVDVGEGFNGLGFYMYHGGNNPHSTIYINDMDAPNTTLQESSFMPAGAQNPMPSESYDFFAPLGEFGQPRQHYHQMRRLHIMIQSWAPLLANTLPSAPAELGAGAGTSSTVRWKVRTDENGAGFLFVNNYQRLQSLPTPRGRSLCDYLAGQRQYNRHTKYALATWYLDTAWSLVYASNQHSTRARIRAA